MHITQFIMFLQNVQIKHQYSNITFFVFNQAEIMAREIAKKISVPIRTDIFFRIKNTKPQRHLNSHERKNNLKNTFVTKKINHKNTTLLDDIFTTGETTNKCFEVLKKSGTNYIFSLTLSITYKNFQPYFFVSYYNFFSFIFFL